MAKLTSFTRAALNMQGYVALNDESKSRYALALRFTPAVCTTLIILGLIQQSPFWLTVMAIIAAVGALFAGGHPIDLIYNYAVRHVVGASALPLNPPPRRFACVVAAVMLLGSAFSFQAGMTALGFLLGGFLSAVGVVVTLTNWCLASWLFGQIFRGQRRA